MQLSLFDQIFYNSILLEVVSIKNCITNILEVHHRQIKDEDRFSFCEKYSEIILIMENSIFTKNEASEFNYNEFQYFVEAFKKSLNVKLPQTDYITNFVSLIKSLLIRIDNLDRGLKGREYLF